VRRGEDGPRPEQGARHVAGGTDGSSAAVTQQRTSTRARLVRWRSGATFWSSAADAPRERRPTDAGIAVLGVLAVTLLSLAAPGPTDLDTKLVSAIKALPGLLGWFWESTYAAALLWTLVLVVAALATNHRRVLFLEQLGAVILALGLGGLVAVVERNRKLQARDISLFEIGKTFHTGPGGKLPDEVRRLGIALSGMRFDPHWSEKGRPVDFYDIKGIAESLLGPMELKPSNHGHLKPGCQADIVLDGSIIGTVGSVHPDILGLMDTDDEILVLEVLLEPVLVRRWEGLREIPKFPSTWRDLSLVVDENVCYADIVAGIQSKGIREIRQVAAVDVYLGDKLPTGKKGVTIRITYQSDERTLEDAMISRWQDRIVASLRDDLGITLRQ